MKILLIHSDFLEYEPKKKAIPSAEDVEKEKMHLDDCLVVFCSAEEGDNETTVKNTINEIKDVAKQVEAKKIVIYPFVHLSSKPAQPSTALKILKAIEKGLAGFEVHRAPFGWYKSFTIKCKGHPLSELSREITSEKIAEEVSESLKKEEEVKSEWFVMTPKGELIPAEKFDFAGHENLKKFWSHEVAKVRAVGGVPAHVKYMRALGLADYEPGSDPGNLRYYPKGRLIKSLLEKWVTEKVLKYGAMEVETPIMYDYEHPALKDYLNRFPARQYIVESAKKKFFLRFSACFGQFLMKSMMNISYRNLPLKMYELTKYSFRLEKAGELVGLRRLRTFTMPDMHTVCADLAQAKQEYINQFKLSIECMNDIGINDYETAIRFTKDFWEKNQDSAKSLVKLLGRPVLIERWNTQFAYFVIKFEFNFVDAMNKASALSTVQIDVENAQRYGIQFTDKDNKRKYPIILHCSPSGAIERVMYALLEKAYLDFQKKKNPMLPLWLSPTQVRLCPVNDSFIPMTEHLADEMEKHNIRIDVDDRTESISRKVRDAEVEWVPMIIVIGEKEKSSGKLAVRFRETGKTEQMTLNDVVKHVRDKTKGFPFRPLPLSRLLTKRPVFVG